MGPVDRRALSIPRTTIAPMALPSNTLPPEVVDAWRRGDHIEAIKRLRQATGVGLAEAKAALDAFDGRTARRASGSAATKGTLAPGEVPSSRPGTWTVA